MIGIGSPRASLESNFALRELVGEENFYSGIELREWGLLHRMVYIMQSSAIPVATLREVEEHDAVLILGEDITQTAARLALSVRQAVKGKARQMARNLKIDRWQAAAIKTVGQNERYPLLQTHIDVTRLDDVATTVRSPPMMIRARNGICHCAPARSSCPCCCRFVGR